MKDQRKKERNKGMLLLSLFFQDLVVWRAMRHLLSSPTTSALVTEVVNGAGGVADRQARRKVRNLLLSLRHARIASVDSCSQTRTVTKRYSFQRSLFQCSLDVVVPPSQP